MAQELKDYSFLVLLLGESEKSSGGAEAPATGSDEGKQVEQRFL